MGPWLGFAACLFPFHSFHVLLILFYVTIAGQPIAISWAHTSPICSTANAFFHGDVRTGDTVAWPTNLGWTMVPWLVFHSLFLPNLQVIVVHVQCCRPTQSNSVDPHNPYPQRGKRVLSPRRQDRGHSGMAHQPWLDDGTLASLCCPSESGLDSPLSGVTLGKALWGVHSDCWGVHAGLGA